ncbi:hypothetical protein NMY22_g7950 [Coprinellus aureogranulatus]|nr:hypothetical protein NMY22_g7950 [Coprinellus aureogranulatus]
MSDVNNALDGLLPQELLEAIVDAVKFHLKAEATSTLASLSLTCRALVPRCRRHLFRVVKFDHSAAWGSGYSFPRDNASRVQAFLALVTEEGSKALGPPIGDYVQSLKIDNNISPLFPQITARLPNLKQFDVMSSFRKYDERAFLEYEVLHEVTEGLVDSLHQKELRYILSQDYAKRVAERLTDTSWLHPLVPLRLERLLISNSTEDLRPLANFIPRCLHVQRNVAQRSLPDESVSSTHPLVAVRRFQFYSQNSRLLGAMMDMEGARPTFSSVEHFNMLVYSRFDEEPVHTLLRNFTVSLIGLELNLSLCNSDALLRRLEGLDLSALPNLKHLRLVNWPRAPNEPMLSLPDEFVSLITTYGTAPTMLETALLMIQRAQYDGDGQALALSAEDDSWERARRFVKDNRDVTFSRLRSFKVHFHAADFRVKPDDSRIIKVRERLEEVFDLGDGILSSVVFT